MGTVSRRKLTLTVLIVSVATSTVTVSQRQPSAPAASVPVGVVDLNTATRLELMTLEGVNAETAEKIVKGRPYKSADELKERKVVDEAVYEKIKTRVRVNQAAKPPQKAKQPPIKAPFGAGPGEK